MNIDITGNVAIMRINENTIDNVLKTNKIATSILYKTIEKRELDYILILTNDYIHYVCRYEQSDKASYEEIEDIFKSETHENWKTLIKLNEVYKIDTPILATNISTRKISNTQTISYLSDIEIKGFNKRLERYDLIKIN